VVASTLSLIGYTDNFQPWKKINSIVALPSRSLLLNAVAGTAVPS